MPSNSYEINQMPSLQASLLLFSFPSSSSLSPSKKINAAIQVPKLRRLQTRNMEDQTARDRFINTIPTRKDRITKPIDDQPLNSTGVLNTQLYAILEAVADRVEMHTNVGEQRDNWNTLLLNSINMIILTAATLAGFAAIGGGGVPLLALKSSSTLLYAAATGMLLVMNKLQPSQLAEEQRNAARLFRQLLAQIQSILALRSPTQEDVKGVMENVLALDKAYPLPLLGAMLDKFPAKFEPAVWWPSNQLRKGDKTNEGTWGNRNIEKNGWSAELEMEMRSIIEVVQRKDMEDYVRLGSLVLKINKILAISGPLLTGIAAFGSAFVGTAPLAAVVAVTAGALASTVAAFEHGGQVGMVFEMYRNCAGFFRLLEESIESTLEERDLEKRENGELFEMKVALQLGRSLSQLRELARKSASTHGDGTQVDEFASKLF